MGKIILHCDMNNFYASVECREHPELDGLPVAVGGDIEKRHGIILAKNYPARAFGIKTGEPITKAKQKCPDLIILSPHFHKYLNFSNQAKEIYYQYTDQVESFGLDECWLDVTGSTRLFGDGKSIADSIRDRMKKELGLTVSVGVSYNKIFAKLGSDMKKPDATTVISEESFRKIVWPLPVRDLLYVGRSTEKKLQQLGILSIGDLAQAELKILRRNLGKHGVKLWSYANGLDQAPVTNMLAEQQIKSIGNSTTTPHDLETEEEVRLTLYVVCESVAARLRKHNLQCRGVQICVRNERLEWSERQCQLKMPANQSKELFEATFALFQQELTNEMPLRGIGVRGFKLMAEEQEQLSFLPEMEQKQKLDSLERTIDKLRSSFGRNCVRRGIFMVDESLSEVNPKDDHIVSLVSFD